MLLMKREYYDLLSKYSSLKESTGADKTSRVESTNKTRPMTAFLRQSGYSIDFLGETNLEELEINEESEEEENFDEIEKMLQQSISDFSKIRESVRFISNKRTD